MLIAMPPSPTLSTFGTVSMAKEIYLDGPAIPFTVGHGSEGHRSFHVPLSVLAEYSIFFHDLHRHCDYIEAEALKFDLFDIDPRTFNRFTIWLYYQTIYVDEGVAQPLDYYEQFEQLWTLADKYRIPQLQRQAEDSAIVLMRALTEQYNFDVLGYWHCIYHNSYVGSPQRRFIAGQCAYLILSGQEKFDPELVHPALRGDIVAFIHNLYPQLY
ncbi:hypothetical protein EG329_003736 [Mollisiaceae sp. DMI_Dod_QoI]|nr:hypothetical protein EG329_003736 [Helotiales sp. DMI_Dod_QoI]